MAQGKPHRRTNATVNRYSYHVSVVADGYSGEEAAFLSACAKYRQAHGKSFLSACDHLRVLKSMGWVPPCVPSITVPETSNGGPQ